MTSPIGLLLGTGWGKITKKINITKTEPYKEIFGHNTSVPGHSGKVIFGKLLNRKVVALSGRFHLYEGYTPHQATKTIGYLHQQGVKKLIISSAAGGLNPKYKVGDLVILVDIISLFSPSPLIGPKFQDMSNPFSEEMKKKAEKAAVINGLNYQKGIYVYMRGPHFETYADKMALRVLGADVVGSSTVPEVIMANYLKMKVLGLSLVTNLSFVKHSHQEVLKAAQNQEKNLYRFIVSLLKQL